MKKHDILLNLLKYNYDRKNTELAPSWKVLLDSNDNNIDHSLNAVAFINESTKNVVISYANSALDKSDFFNVMQNANTWLDIYNGNIPNNFEHVGIEFLHKIVSKLEDGYGDDYQVINIGHQSGAVFSDLATLYFLNEGMQSNSITFESPGTEPMLKESAKNLKIELAKNDEHFISFNSEDNMMNTMQPHFGSNKKIGSLYSGDSYISKVANGINELGSVINFAANAFSVLSRVSTFLPKIAGFNVGELFSSSSMISQYFTKLPTELTVHTISAGLNSIGSIVQSFDKAAYYSDLEKVEELFNHYTATHSNIPGYEFITQMNTGSSALHVDISHVENEILHHIEVDTHHVQHANIALHH